MILYDENKRKTNLEFTTKIGGRTHGSVYKLSDSECIKIYNESIDVEILKLLKELSLKNYYRILEIYYNRKMALKAARMTYYQKEDIDILTMPIDYTLYNLFNIYSSINTLTQNNILVEDLHSENVITTSSEITVIDTDLYSFNQYRTPNGLERKNIERLAYLFKELYKEALLKYHKELNVYEASQIIDRLFTFYTPYQLEETHKKLTKHKYPIDYITKDKHMY